MPKQNNAAAGSSQRIHFIDLATVGAFLANCWIEKLSANLRAADVAEIAAAVGLTPEETIRMSVHYSSHGWVILDSNREPIGIFGAVPGATPGTGVMWMLGTDGIGRNARQIARNTRPYLDRLNRVYPYLWNYVDARHEASLRWLRWAGCEIVGEDHSYGVEQQLFYAFGRAAPSATR